MMKKSCLVVAACLAWMSIQSEAASLPETLRVPPGFSVGVLARVPGARSMALGDKGTLFVSTQRGSGNVYAIRDPLGKTPQVVTLATGLKMPNGIAFHAGALYVAEPQRILRMANVESQLDKPPPLDVLIPDLPYKGMLHSWKYIGFGPDGRLYVPVGAPCNNCDEPGFGIIMRMNSDGSGREIFARGVRNSVGLTWHPESGDLWFTDNGRDMLGDDVPPCELNRAERPGLHFGYPFCHGGSIADPELGSLGRCEDSVPPVQPLGPHVAPLGLRFYTGNMFPAAYRNQIFIAEHGSWNRSKAAGKTGYRVSLVRLSGNQAIGYETFMDGFLDGEKALGRPVDVLVAQDGSLLVSDDTGGAIYRVTYDKAGE